MRDHSGLFSRLFILLAIFSMGFTASSVLHAQQTEPTEPLGVPEDWSHHHLYFSTPETEEEAIRNGTYLDWLQIVTNPRYIYQQLKRRLPAQGPAADKVARVEEQARGREISRFGEPIEKASDISIGKIKRPAKPSVNNDWSMILGGSATVGAGMSPAKFSFNTTSTPNCGNATTPDFVAFNTSTAGSSSQASIVAYDNLYTSCSGQVPSVYWAFNTGGTVKTSAVLSSNGAQLAFIQTPSSGNAQLVLLTWKATPTGRNVTGSVTNTSANFTFSSGTLTTMDVGAGISGTGIPSGDTIATVTSATAGTLQTAATATHAGETLAITADAGGPDTLSAIANGSYSGCMAPCMTTLSFSGSSRSDNISSPFYDYGTDTLYVGDASGGLHKFHPVFNGTPAEVGTPWTSPSTTALSSPVYDAMSGNAFVGDASGYLYSINSSGTVTKSFEVAVSPGIIDGPLVDSSAGQVYVSVSADMNGSNTGNSACNGLGKGSLACDGVINLPTTFTSSTEYTESVTGVGTTNTLYAGDFDNLYWTTGTGNMYVNSSTGLNLPKLMEVPVTTSGFSTHACQSGTNPPPNASAVQCAINIDNPITSAAAAGGPVTEICNNGASACTSSSTDYIFTSVTANGSLTASGTNKCTDACVYSWTTTTTLGVGTAPTDGLAAVGGTSAIIIDNTSTAGGASQIYFSTLGTSGPCATSGTLTKGGCAVQASQSSL